MSSSNGYTLVPGVDDEVAVKLLNPNPRPLSESHQQPKRVWYHAKTFLVANVFLLLVHFILFGISLRNGTSKGTPKSTECTNYVSTYSPALEAVEYETTVFNGSFLYPSEYRGPPSPDVDMAWKRITKSIYPIRTSEEDLRKTGTPITPSTVKFQEEDGGGYMTALEMNHQLHCLNMLRKYTYREYYEPIDEMFEAKPKEMRGHLDHCIEMLRQRLMCTADTGIITYNWVHGWQSPYPNFNTKHTCRNFEKILSWNYEHGVHIPENRVGRFDDAEDLPQPP